MIHDEYLQLRRDILGSTANEAIASAPLFAKLCDVMPLKVAVLCIESPTVDRAELLDAMKLNAEQCEELLTWLVIQLARIQEHNRGCMRVLLRGASPSFLRRRHAQLQGKTIGVILMVKSAEWAMDLLGELGINPFYDDAGNLCLYEFLDFFPAPIVSTLWSAQRLDCLVRTAHARVRFDAHGTFLGRMHIGIVGCSGQDHAH